MKIAFTSSGDTLDSPLDSRFGRAPKFIVYDTDTQTHTAIDNAQNLNAAQGAGIQSAETVARAGVQHLVTGHCGPKAFRVLTAAGIAIYNCDAPTVREALERFHAGTLKPASAADVEGHWV
ncbi:MAG: dinitrogenase iron-molybdenum cofactor biosynthesis protein [Acidobacteria bacterium]|nr:dinitrogenase iron-molybdenum cofactor biosynthesis protein [Acidobacteriota bacterium]